MGVKIQHICQYHAFGRQEPETPRQVLALASLVLDNLLAKTNLPANLSHLIISTTCPDMLAPSLGQMLVEKYHAHLGSIASIDMVQGCAGGVSALILGSQLAQAGTSSVLVIAADAAQKATSSSKAIHAIFGNGAFAALLSYTNGEQGLLQSQARQYKGLSEVVTVKLGHDADVLIMKHPKDMQTDPRKHLGLDMNNLLAIKLLKQAEDFFKELVAKSVMPDIMILHQVNPIIIAHLKQVFSKYPVRFIDFSGQTGNCGAASVGIAFSKIFTECQGKKVLLCSYGTGGVISGGIWSV